MKLFSKLFSDELQQDSEIWAPSWKPNETRCLFKFGYHHNLLLVIAICLCNLSESRLYLHDLHGVQKATDSGYIKIIRNHRELGQLGGWLWLPTGSHHSGNPWYDHYNDTDEVKAMQSEDYSTRDHGDFLRSGDVCPKKGETDFQHSYCPEAPDCDWSGEWGKAKLCITRVPFPSDFSKFYALSMKCIPYWANCDKCACGIMDGGDNGVCKYDGSGWNEYRFEIDCDNPGTVSMYGYSYTPLEGKSTSSSTQKSNETAAVAENRNISWPMLPSSFPQH